MPQENKQEPPVPEEATREYLLEDKLKQALWLISNMRRAQEYWHMHFGHQNLKTKKRWEQKADDFVKSFGIDDETNIKELKIYPDAVD